MIQHFIGVFYVTVVRLNQLELWSPLSFDFWGRYFVRDNKSNIYFTWDRFDCFISSLKLIGNIGLLKRVYYRINQDYLVQCGVIYLFMKVPQNEPFYE